MSILACHFRVLRLSFVFRPNRSGLEVDVHVFIGVVWFGQVLGRCVLLVTGEHKAYQLMGFVSKVTCTSAFLLQGTVGSGPLFTSKGVKRFQLAG